MCEFKNGDIIEYAIPDLAMRTVNKWDKAEYVGVSPHDRSYHVLQNAGGVFITRLLSQIRKPKVKRYGWMNVWTVHERAAVHGAVAHATYIYATKEEALDANSGNPAKPLDTIRIEWYE